MGSGGSSFTLLEDDLLELLPLPLGSEMSTQSLFQELKGTLFTGDFQELHGPSFIGSETNDFTDDVSDEFVVSSDALENNNTMNRNKKYYF